MGNPMALNRAFVLQTRVPVLHVPVDGSRRSGWGLAQVLSPLLVTGPGAVSNVGC